LSPNLLLLGHFLGVQFVAEQMQLGDPDAEAQASRQSLEQSIDSDLAASCWSQWDYRWTIVGTANALLIMAVVVLGSGNSRFAGASLNMASAAAFAIPFHAPATLGLQPLSTYKHKLRSTSNAVYVRPRPLLYMKMQKHVGKAPPSPASDILGWAMSGALEEAFSRLALIDQDGHGVVSRKDFQTYMDRYGCALSASTQLFAMVDTNGDGKIDINEVRFFTDEDEDSDEDLQELLMMLGGSEAASDSELDSDYDLSSDSGSTARVSQEDYAEMIRERREKLSKE